MHKSDSLIGRAHRPTHLMDLNINRPVPGAKGFYPLNEPGIGTTLSPVRVCQVVKASLGLASESSLWHSL